MEIALYNMYSILWEIETGSVYRMTKPNDIYSGLGQFDKSLEVTRKDEDKEAEESVGEKKDLLDTIIEETEEAGVESEESRVEELPEPPSTQGNGDQENKPEEQITPPLPPTEAVPVSPVASATSLAVSSTQSLLAPLELRKKQEASLVRAIQRAETIVESFDGIKVSYTHFAWSVLFINWNCHLCYSLFGPLFTLLLVAVSAPCSQVHTLLIM